MDLEFSDEESQLAGSVRDVLAGICPPSVVRGVYEGTGDASDVWRQMVALDWPGLAIDEAHGGVGMGFLELAIVSEQLGRACVPGPLLATTTQFAPAIRELGDDAARSRFLHGVASGALTGTLALAEDGRWMVEAVRTTAEPETGGRWRLDGTKQAVLDGATADEVVIIARGPDGIGAFVVAGSDVQAVARSVLDPTMPIADLTLDGVVVPADRVLATPGPGVSDALERVVEEATVSMAMVVVGACRSIFERTVEYAKQREQYGRPIGSFQALKHRMADMYLAVERASSLCWYAALTIAEDDGRRSEAASLAKAAVGECQHLLVGEGLQLHGGIGYTWEHDLHFLLKRAKTADALWGNTSAHRSKLAASLGITRRGAAA